MRKVSNMRKKKDRDRMKQVKAKGKSRIKENKNKENIKIFKINIQKLEIAACVNINKKRIFMFYLFCLWIEWRI